MHVTLYSGAQNPVPVSSDDFGSWPEWAESLHDLVSRVTEAPLTASAKEQKLSLLAWAPHLLSAPHRQISNVVHVSMLVLDVDDAQGLGPVDLAERAAALAEHGVVYGSPSDTPERRRLRVVVPVSRPILPEECRRTRLAFAEALGLGPGCGVEESADAAKIFFAGRLHGTAERLWIDW